MKAISHHIKAQLDQAAREQHERDQLAEEVQMRLAPALGKHTLYRYRGLRSQESKDRVEDILRRNRLYCAHPGEFNDPFDCAAGIDLAGNPEDPEFFRQMMVKQERLLQQRPAEEQELIREATPVPIAELAARLAPIIREHINSAIRILCLSGDSMHPLCWSHYSGEHTGICLHFSTSPSSIFQQARKIIYQKERRALSLDGRDLTERADEVFETLVLTKASFWDYEDEYRIILSDIDWPLLLDADSCVSFPPAALTGMTLGMRISDADRHWVVGLVAETHPGLPIWQARMHPDRFWMESDRIAQ